MEKHTPRMVDSQEMAITSRLCSREARRLLEEAGLPLADLSDEYLADFYGCRSPSGLVGIIGFERYGTIGLLRSWAIATQYRGRGLGALLISHVERLAQVGGIEVIYLLTETAEGYFARLGYEIQPRDTAPAELCASTEWIELCPASATLMLKRLADKKRLE